MDSQTIQRVEQTIIEDTQNKVNARKVLRHELSKLDNQDFRNTIDTCAELILKYKDTTYTYESKNKRMKHIQQFDSEVLAVNLLIAVLPIVNKSPIQNVAARLANHLRFTDIFDGIKTASELIAVCAHVGCYQLWLNPVTIQATLPLPTKILDYLANLQYPNPMICTPDDWDNNMTGGYLTTSEHILLGKHNNHMQEQALDALNKLQKIKWSLDMNMVNFIEKPKNKCETKKQIEGHMLQTRRALDVYQEMVNQGNEFYFVWKYDFRGRMYSQGYYINLQSTDYKKALLNFSKKQIIRG